MKISKNNILIITILIIFSFSIIVNAGNVGFKIFSSGMRINKEVESIAELRFKNVVKQKYDISCGSAALATIFQYNYNDDISEQEIIDMILGIKNLSSLKNQSGFSLLDLKMAAEFFDYNAYGLTGSLSAIKQIKLPMIVLLDAPQGPHFVVLRKINEDSVQVADPALGNQTMKIDAFEKQWNKILLAIESKNKALNDEIENPLFPIMTGGSRLLRTLNDNWVRLPFSLGEF
jgi:predicted double-glycine peptidase